MLKLLWKKGCLPMRPTWKGSISFGLVYIPVAVYPATREEKISFRQLRSSDLSPIRYKKVAEADSKEVPADQIVKGFEYERGRYVEKLWIDLLQVHEVGNIDGMCGLDPHLLKVFVLQHYITAPLVLEAFHDLVGRNFL